MRTFDSRDWSVKAFFAGETRLSGGHPVLPWLVKNSVAIVNRCRRGPDANELRKGASSRERCRFSGEKILFMIHGVTKCVARVVPRWED